jgi:hypothetical protein
VEPNDAVEEGAGDRRRHVRVAHLEKQSTTVRMTDFLWTLGRPSMKSMEMSAHTCEGTSRG